MRHQYRHFGAAQDVLGKAAEDPLAQSAVTVAAHHEQRRVLAGGGEQGVRGAVSVGLQMTKRDRNAVPAKTGHQAIGLFFGSVLILGNAVLAKSDSFAGLVLGVTLWGAHMALTQGIFARMIADSAPEQLRATSFGAFWFVTGIASLLASLGAGFLWDREGPSATFFTSAAVAAVALAMLSLLEEERPSSSLGA